MGLTGKVVFKLKEVESSRRFEKSTKTKTTKTANLENILQFIKPKSIELSPKFIATYKAQKDKKIGPQN